ncbi:MAG TPA: hypothetical protein VF060_30590 [Trebonia sp.]
MTCADELIALAEEAREDLGGDAEVRIACYPVRAALQYVTIPHSTDPGELYGPDETAPASSTTARSCGWPGPTSRTARQISTSGQEPHGAVTP